MAARGKLTFCEVCHARNVDDCMLLQRAAARKAESKGVETTAPTDLSFLWEEDAKEEGMFVSTRTVDEMPFKGEVITVCADDPVEEGMKKLIENHVSAVPVVPRGGGIPMGFLDVADLCTIVAKAHSFDGVGADAFATFRSLLVRSELHAKKVADVYACARTDPYIPLSPRSPMLKAVCILGDSVGAGEGEKNLVAHRLLVLDPLEDKIVKVVSQSSVLQYLEDVKDSYAMTCGRKLIVATEDEPVMNSIQTMLRLGISGLPIVDASGLLTGHISNFDPAAMLAANTRVEFAGMSTKEFAEQAHALRFPKESDLMRRRRKPLGLAGAVTVKRWDSLAYVLHTMLHHHVHRVFVVDADKKPVGIVSARDLLRELVTKMKVPLRLRAELFATAKGGREAAKSAADDGEDESKA